ncbi:MAG: hypothetical protein U9N42_04965 [Campylobacterota bacterium]|nr:hypothetical protein [Campylobacterota bacterium]
MADNVTTEDLELALQDLASSMGLSVAEYVQLQGYATVAELTASISGVQAQITAITEMEDNGVESLAEKVKAINDVLVDENGVIQAIFTKIQENKQLVLDETARATGVEADLQGQVTTNLNRNTANEVAITALTATVASNKVEAIAEAIAHSDAQDVITRQLIADEEARALLAEADNRTTSDLNIATAKAEAIVDANTYTDLVGGRVEVIENTLNDTVDADGNLVKGTVTKVEDNAAAIAALSSQSSADLAQTILDLQAYSDARDLKASSMDMCSIKSKFRTALGLTSDCSGSTGDGAVI